MFKYRVLTFTIILSMLLFYATPINSVVVKAEEVTYTQRQLQDVGAWFIGERLLEGAISDFDFSNLPTDLTPEDFLADLGAVFAEGDPLPLMNDMSQAIDDIWNGLVEEYSNLSSEQAWDMVKDFFYTLWYDVPQTPSLPPLINVFGIAGDLLEAADIDYLLQYANSDIEETHLPEDYLWLQNINNLFIYDYNFFDSSSWLNQEDGARVSAYSIMGDLASNDSVEGIIFNHHFTGNGAFNGVCLNPKIKLYLNYDSTSEKYVLTYTSYSLYNPSGSTLSDNLHCYFRTGAWNQPKIDYALYNNSPGAYNIQTTFDGFNIALNYIYTHFSNIDLYVDNVLWVQGYVEPVNPIANTDLTYPNYEPAKYNYPEGTSVDWNRLYSIIYNAVRDGIVLDFGDLENCFVDVNGQTAIATLGIVRNDYDNLVQEQFTMVPYPRFNDNLWLTNLAEEMTEPAQNGVAIIENAYNIFPLPLQKALLFAGALLLFGFLIRRFLE